MQPDLRVMEQEQRVAAIREIVSDLEAGRRRAGQLMGKLSRHLIAAADAGLTQEALSVIAAFSTADGQDARWLRVLFAEVGAGLSVPALQKALGCALDRTEAPDAICALLIEQLSLPDGEAAVELARTVLGRKVGLPQSLRAAAWALRAAMGPSDSLAALAMRQAIKVHPSDTTLLRAWFDDRHEEGGMLAALDRLAELAAEPGAPPSARQMLARWTRHKPEADIRTLSDQAAEDSWAVWDDHVHGRPGDAAQWARVAELRPNVIRAALLRRVTRMVPLASDHPYHLRTMRQAGIDPARLRGWADGFLSPGSQAWREVIQGPGVASAAVRQRLAANLEASTGWQDRVVAEGSLICPCPVDGELHHAFDSVVAQGVTYYAFAGRETFYFLAGGYSMRAYGLWCPGRNLLITFGADNGLTESPVLFGAVGSLVRRIAANQKAWHAARAAPFGPRRVTVLVRQIRNFAHQVWNMYSGFERLAVAGLLPKIHRVVHFNQGFFGSFGAIYPELPPGLVEEQPSTPLQDPGTFSTQDIIVPVGGYFMARGLRDRIGRAMAEHPALPGAPDPATATRPIVWIGIRVTDKGWIDQERGIAEMCRHILARHPAATFVVDGFTLPLGAATVASDWAPALARMEEVVAGLGKELGRPDRIVSLVGQTMREAIIWAGAADVYVAPRGTSQHKVGWFSDAAGIIYTDKDSAQKPESMPGCWEAEGAPQPFIVTGIADANGGDAVVVRTPRPRMENLHIDPVVVADAVLEALAARMPAQSLLPAERVNSVTAEREMAALNSPLPTV